MVIIVQVSKYTSLRNNAIQDVFMIIYLHPDFEILCDFKNICLWINIDRLAHEFLNASVRRISEFNYVIYKDVSIMPSFFERSYTMPHEQFHCTFSR